MEGERKKEVEGGDEGERKKEVEGGDGGREKEGGGRRDGEIKGLRKVLVVLEGRVCGGRGRG